MNTNTSLPSMLLIIDDIREIFELIINYFDPFKTMNRKPKVLDISNSYYWTEKTSKLYDVTKTNKLSGFAKDKKYNIIFFEPPRNKNFTEVVKEHINAFYDLLYRGGIIVVRITDFKLNGRLCGSYDIHNMCAENQLYLSDVIVYKNKQNRYDDTPEKPKDVNLIHSNFMIFKKEADYETWN